MLPWIRAGSVRERNTCVHMCTHTNTHTDTTVRFGKGFVAAKSCAKRAWLFSYFWDWWCKESGQFAFLLPKKSRIREMYNLEWPAALPHWRILGVLCYGVFPWPWQHSLIFLFWMPSAPRVGSAQFRTHTTLLFFGFCFLISVSFWEVFFSSVKLSTSWGQDFLWYIYDATAPRPPPWFLCSLHKAGVSVVVQQACPLF